MEAEEVRIPLPEELVERVLAMVPFPQVLKARVLSKSWLARFSSTSSIPDGDEEKKKHAMAFQKRMGEYWSRTWKTFCPVFLGKDDLLAYDRECEHWLIMPSLSFLPRKHHSRLAGILKQHMELEGALVLIRTMSGSLSVANVLTQTWRELPDCQIDGVSYLVSHTSSDTYMVIMFHEETGELAMVYDSKVVAWSDKPIYLSEGFKRLSNRVSVNGVSYWVVGPVDMPKDLLSFNFDTQAFQVLQMQSTTHPIQAKCFYLVVCNGTIIMVGGLGRPTRSVSVVKIDLGSRKWLEVTRGPPVAPYFHFYSVQPASDGGDCIFFLGNEHGIMKVMAYNVTQDEWRYIPVPAIVGQRIVGQTYIEPKAFYTRTPTGYTWILLVLRQFFCRGQLEAQSNVSFFWRSLPQRGGMVFSDLLPRSGD